MSPENRMTQVQLWPNMHWEAIYQTKTRLWKKYKLLNKHHKVQRVSYLINCFSLHSTKYICSNANKYPKLTLHLIFQLWMSLLSKETKIINTHPRFYDNTLWAEFILPSETCTWKYFFELLNTWNKHYELQIFNFWSQSNLVLRWWVTKRASLIHLFQN